MDSDYKILIYCLLGIILMVLIYLLFKILLILGIFVVAIILIKKSKERKKVIQDAETE